MGMRVYGCVGTIGFVKLERKEWAHFQEHTMYTCFVVVAKFFE